jgi:hypothetical protein
MTKSLRYKGNTITGSAQRIKESEDEVWKLLCRINGVPYSGEIGPGFRDSTQRVWFRGRADICASPPSLP